MNAGMTNIDFSTVAAIATERYNQALREAGREDAVSRRPTYSPADVMYILAAAVEANGTPGQDATDILACLEETRAALKRADREFHRLLQDDPYSPELDGVWLGREALRKRLEGAEEIARIVSGAEASL